MEVQNQEVVTPPATEPVKTEPVATETVTPPVKTNEGTTEVVAETTQTPEELAYELKLAEGSHLSAEEIEEVKAFAKENKLSVEQAQKVLDQRHVSVDGFLKKRTDLLKQQSDAWAKELQADPEVGGEKFKESVAIAHSVVEKFGTEDLKKMFNDTALGNHPAFFKFLLKIGKQGQPDNLVQGKVSTKVEKSAAQLFYPNLYKENE